MKSFHTSTANSLLSLVIFLSFSSCTLFSDKPEALPKPVNVIFLIGDGMGLSQVTGAMGIKDSTLAMEHFPFTGFAKTYSANNYITDSAAAGTALATGTKTNNKAIGVDTNKQPLRSILMDLAGQGLSTGIVVTSYVTHATPASFYAHEEDRNSYEAIAKDFLDSDMDLIIGGGRNHFEARSDSVNVSETLREKGYQVVYTLEEAEQAGEGKLVGLLADEHMPVVAERGDMLPRSVALALSKLSKNNKGFFLMVEGSQIDFEGHDNRSEILDETVDFDNAVALAYEFARKNGNTLVIVTADHETGGLALPRGNMRRKTVETAFAITQHTATMVPVFAYGPGAALFTGTMENTDIPKKIRQLMRVGE